MERQAKFRAWDTVDKEMIDWAGMRQTAFNRDGGQGYGLMYKIFTNQVQGIDTPGFILMQWTGLVDKHGTEIYEGDVLDFTFDGVAFIKNPTYVVFEQGAFLINKKNFKPLVSDCENVYIVGNIFQHPELLNP